MKRLAYSLILTLLFVLGISLIPEHKVSALSSGPLVSQVAATTPAPACESSGFSLSWIVCPIVEGIAEGEQELGNIVSTLLTTQVVSFTSTTTSADKNQQFSSAMYTVWSNFRIYGNIVLIIAVLSVVIGEIIGGGVIDAYTARKVLPKILIAAILINLSIYIVAALEDVFNVLGAGIQALLSGPFQALKNANGTSAWAVHLPGGSGDLGFALLAGFAGYAGITLGIGGILLFVFGTVILAAFGVLITLMFRQGLLVFLVLLSPVAFALYALPATEQYFRRWWDLLFKTLLVYPIVTIIFIMCDITGVITGNFLGAGANNSLQLIYSLMGILALVAPLFLIPFSFRIAGGAIGNIHNVVSGVTNAGKQGIANTRKGIKNERMERARAGNLFRGEGRIARRMSHTVQTGTLVGAAGLKPWKMRSKVRAGRSARLSALSAKAGESEGAAALAGNDDILTAALHGDGSEEASRQYLSQLGQRGDELNQNVASITQAKREMGRAAFEDFAASNLAGTGTGYASGPAEMLQTINRVAGNDRARAARILNASRGQAERARRVDLYGAGFAVSADQMGQLHTGHTNAAAVNETMTDEALYTKSAGEVGTARNNALTNMTGAIQRRLARSQVRVDQARATGNPQLVQMAEHVQKQALAATAGLQDVAGQASTENAQVIGAIMGSPGGQWHDSNLDVRDAAGNLVSMGVNRGTVGHHIETLRDDAEFQQYRREYGSMAGRNPAAQAAQAQAVAQANQQSNAAAQAAAAAQQPPPGGVGGGPNPQAP